MLYILLPYLIVANGAAIGFNLQRLWLQSQSRPLNLELPE